MLKKIKIVVAGASGYIGKAMIPKLLEKFPDCEITALSRSQQDSDDPRIIWKACDLFSLKSIEDALPTEVDLAFYLVHSMGPTAALDQGNFADYDLILADNFARQLKKLNIKQLIYLGGLIPQHHHTKLSLHLQSRLEVEDTFRAHKLPLTVFRAGLILGDEGSSFQILLKLVNRLPIMVCPSWTQTLTTPVDLATVLMIMTAAALEEKHIDKVYDLAGCQPLSYVNMMRETAKQLGKKRLFLTVPFFTPALSGLWVSLITNTPRNLVYPLVESLKYNMLPRENHKFRKEFPHKTYAELLETASLKTYPGKSLFHFKAQRKTVRSVQRLPLPQGKDAEWVKNQYIHWLPKFMAPIVRVKLEGPEVWFSIFVPQFVLLELKFSPERSDADRQLLYIKNPDVDKMKTRGRLEFRVVLNRRYALAAIHDYRPAHPWFLYKYTQAKVHIFVMAAFRRYLARKKLPMKNVN